jgi:hypothetical protein
LAGDHDGISGNTALADNSGAFLIMAGFVGLALSRNKEVKSDPASLPGDEPEPKPKRE